MAINSHSRFRAPLTLSLICLVSACVADGPGKGLPAETASTPRTATYRCDDGSIVSIENRGTSVVISDAVEGGIELPASPAMSRSRYGGGGYALVLEDGEALWMKAGQEPETCLR